MFARVAVLVVLLSTPAFANPSASLRGSLASVARMYRVARAQGLRFYSTSSAVRSAVSAGRLVPLTSNDYVEIDTDVGYPYARPETRRFVNRFGAQYHAACGERLVITSAVRPSSRQPVNSSRRSVHPTGMAVDLRKPDGRCLTWLRSALLGYEDRGVIEATEEHEPAHFHVAVFAGPR